MNAMLNVLINAYAVSPNWGSEPGMGWNWIIKYCSLLQCFCYYGRRMAKDISIAP